MPNKNTRVSVKGTRRLPLDWAGLRAPEDVIQTMVVAVVAMVRNIASNSFSSSATP